MRFGQGTNQLVAKVRLGVETLKPKKIEKLVSNSL